MYFIISLYLLPTLWSITRQGTQTVVPPYGCIPEKLLLQHVVPVTTDVSVIIVRFSRKLPPLPPIRQCYRSIQRALFWPLRMVKLSPKSTTLHDVLKTGGRFITQARNYGKPTLENMVFGIYCVRDIFF